jgi:hypothetical protein
VNARLEDVDGLPGGLGQVAEPHGHREVELGHAPVRRKLNLQFWHAISVSGLENRLRTVLAGKPREHVERLAALVGLGPGAACLVDVIRAAELALFPDLVMLKIVLFGRLCSWELLDEVGEGVVGEPDHLLSAPVQRTRGAGFEPVLKSGVLDSLENFLPQRGLEAKSLNVFLLRH